MTDRELMQQALDALEGVVPYTDSLICYASTVEEHPPNAIDGKVSAAIDALRDRLARQDDHSPDCHSLTRMLMSMPPKPAPCNCKLAQQEQDCGCPDQTHCDGRCCKPARQEQKQEQGLHDFMTYCGVVERPNIVRGLFS